MESKTNKSKYHYEIIANNIQKKIKDGMDELDIIRLIGQDLRDQGFSAKQVSYFLNVDEDFISDVLGNLDKKYRDIIYKTK